MARNPYLGVQHLELDIADGLVAQGPLLGAPLEALHSFALSVPITCVCQHVHSCQMDQHGLAKTLGRVCRVCPSSGIAHVSSLTLPGHLAG